MSEEHPNPNPMDDPAAQPLLMGFVVGILLTLVTIIASAAIYFRGVWSAETRIAEDTGRIQAAEVRTKQLETLAKVEWIDREKGVVRLPIDDAIAITARELTRKGAN